MFKISIAGDTIINRSIAHIRDESANHIFELFKDSDLAVANCETLFHDYVGEGVFPAVEAGWSYMRSAPYIAAELRALGFRLMGTANNHTLDYSYGGMLQTHAELTKAGIEHALGTGPRRGAVPRLCRYRDAARCHGLDDDELGRLEPGRASAGRDSGQAGRQSARLSFFR